MKRAAPRRVTAAQGEVTLTIDSLAAGGDGIGHAPDGRVVFVPFTAPGDRVVVAIEPGAKRYARGRVVALQEAGPARTDPLCAVFGSCGGCAWQHVDYAAQVAAKRRILSDALVRIGGFELSEGPALTPCPSPYAYRGRTRVVVAQGRVGYRRRRSHAVCATARCPILVPALDEALAALAAQPPHEDGEWELAAGLAGEVRVTPLGEREATGSRIALMAGADRIERSPGVFAQSNQLLLDALAGAVWRASRTGARVIELFAGAGFFTLGLARRFEQVVAVEGEPLAARDLARNLEQAGLRNVEVVTEPVERALAGRLQRGGDAIVLDPPRTGLPQGFAGRIAALGACRVVYLSCDPATLARDLSEIAAAGYRLAHVEGFDLFPQTPHLEALAVLEQEGAG
jgi:tRNA/tmRNA/rRNA uracil-C5-methylase (TrmA/RlmC/RlmD family)